MKRTLASTSKHSTPEDDEKQQRNPTCPGHVLEFASILLAVDGQFVSIMREREPMQTAKLLRLLLWKFNEDEDIQPTDDDIAVLSINQLLPKCDDRQVNEMAEFLLTTKQVELIDKSDGPIPGNDALQLNYENSEVFESLPLETLDCLLVQNSVDKVGGQPARALRDELMAAGVLASLLDGLSFYSQQPNRYETDKLLGSIPFVQLPRPPSSSQLLRTPKNKRPKPVPAARGGRARRRGGRSGGYTMSRGGKHGNGHGGAESSQQQTETDIEEEYWVRKKNDRCIEAILKVLNSFLMDTNLVEIGKDWLSLLFRSSLRNFVRASLMNGDLSEIVRLSQTYGAMFQLLNTLANANPVYVEDMTADIYGKVKTEGGPLCATLTCSALVQPLDLVLGKDPDEKENNPTVFCPTSSSSSSSPTTTSPSIVDQLSIFARKIDDHCKLLMKTVSTQGEQNDSNAGMEEGAEAEELMTLGSLSSICVSVIRTIAQQKAIMELNLKQSPPDISKISSSEQKSASVNTTTNRKTYELRSRSGSRGKLWARSSTVDTSGTPCSSKLGTEVDAGGSNTQSSSMVAAEEDLAKRYCQALKELQFATIPFDGQHPIPHFFRTKFNGAGSSMGMANQRIKRIGKELFALRADLPLTVSSSVFVRTSEEHMDALKVLITGPSDTPYASGCFEFDFYLDANFPNQAPKVQFMTTGNGQVRFNPNLYNCGKVCLSLLGTWPGDNKTQEWNAQTSTISQVITSIQGLILVPDPYFNEPGFEHQRGRPEGKKPSTTYNLNIQHQTLRWAIIEQMRNPPRGFEEVVRKHFWLKKDQIVAQLDQWVKENSTISTLKGKLQEEFVKLEKIMAAGGN